jgi:hypothetical protein
MNYFDQHMRRRLSGMLNRPPVRVWGSLKAFLLAHASDHAMIVAHFNGVMKGR